MSELTDLKPGDTVSWPSGGDIATGTVEKVRIDGVGGSTNHANDAAKPVEQDSPAVHVTQGATTVVKPIGEVEPAKPAQNHSIAFSAASASDSQNDKKDEREHIPQKNENGIAPKDGPNGTVRARSKSPAVVPVIPTAAKIVEDKPPIPAAVPDPPVVIPAVPKATLPFSDSTVVPPPGPSAPEVVAPSGTTETVVPAEKPAPALPEVRAEPVAAPVPAPVPVPVSAPVPPPVSAPVPVAVPVPVSVPVPAPAPVLAPVQPTVSAEPVAKKPGPKPKAPKKERPQKRAATETGEPRRSKRNKPE